MKMTQPTEYYMKLPYGIYLVPPDEESEEWFARISDLPGCTTQAPTRDEALTQIEEAKRLWLESQLEANQPIPEPIEMTEQG